ncbi:hypothetical protein [Luteimonas salinilitoris]|uniref:hypothetical protein n=1 Tax=Luteimonas salinilitoris TaxID=3237697 RepID=UPI00351C25C4
MPEAYGVCHRPLLAYSVEKLGTSKIRRKLVRFQQSLHPKSVEIELSRYDFPIGLGTGEFFNRIGRRRTAGKRLPTTRTVLSQLPS